MTHHRSVASQGLVDKLGSICQASSRVEMEVTYPTLPGPRRTDDTESQESAPICTLNLDNQSTLHDNRIPSKVLLGRQRRTCWTLA